MSGVLIAGGYQSPNEFSGNPNQAYRFDATTLYVFGQPGNADVDDHQNIRAFRSTDNGASWSAVDTAHEPISTRGVSYGLVRSGNIVYVSHVAAYSDPDAIQSGVVKITPFNMSAGTWGSVSADGPVISRHPRYLLPAYARLTMPQFLAARPGGELVLIYWNDYSVTAAWRYVRFSGGTWSSPVVISDLTTNVWPNGVVSDSSGNVHMVCSDTSGTVLYLVLKADNTFVAIQTVATQTITPSQPQAWFQGAAQIASTPIFADGLVHFAFGIVTSAASVYIDAYAATLALKHASANPATFAVTVDAIAGTNVFFRNTPRDKPISINSTGTGTYDVYYVVSDYEMYRSSWNGSAWSSPASSFVDTDELGELLMIYSGADGVEVVGVRPNFVGTLDLVYLTAATARLVNHSFFGVIGAGIGRNTSFAF
jgi:hypothetical protein